MDLGKGLGHLTYSTLVHQTDNWEQLWKSVNTYLPAVKARVAPHEKFGVCLRTSAPSIEQLSTEPTKVADLKTFFADNDLYLYTANAFVYGVFKKQVIKEDVYEPDWATPERREYTKKVANLLAELAPDGINPSIQTAPLGFKPKVTGEDVVDAYTSNVIDVVAHLVDLKKRTGKMVTLGLEPEPRCYLETTDETITYFKDRLFSGPTAQAAGEDNRAERSRRGAGDARLHGRRLRHRPPVRRLRGHPGVAAEAGGQRRADRQAAGSGVDAYPRCHTGQGGRAADVRQDDLPVADLPEEGREDDVVPQPRGRVRGLVQEPGAARVAHALPRAGVPHRAWPRFGTTRFGLEQALAVHKKTPLSTHLEIETYTWDVLPDHLKTGDIVEYVTRELDWVKGQLLYRAVLDFVASAQKWPHRASLLAAPGSRRGKSAPPAWTDEAAVALDDPYDSLQIVSVVG